MPGQESLCRLFIETHATDKGMLPLSNSTSGIDEGECIIRENGLWYDMME
jgi:hypothetical protein